MSTTRIFDTRKPSHEGNTIIIWPRAAARRLSASRGGRLEFAGGAVSFAPNTLVNARGVPASGEVDVAFSTFDVQDSRQLRSVPGDFTARMRDGSIRQLETYGVFEVYVADAAGQRLNLAKGATATVEIPRRGRPRREPGLYRFDAVDGRWIEVGTFTLQELSLSAQVADLLPSWNADDPLNTACIKVQVLGCRGCEASPQQATVDIVVEGKDYVGTSPQPIKDASGYCVSVKSGAVCTVTVTDPSINKSGNPMEIATPTVLASSSDCGDPLKCPLVVATHTVAQAFTDPLTAADINDLRWCPSNGWANAAPADTWWDSNLVTFSGTGMKVSLAQCSGCGRTYASGEYKTECFHGYGTYEATIDPALVPGMVTGFFTYTDSIALTGDGTIGENNTDGHDEVDIEILGGHPCPPGKIAVQANWIARNIGVNRHEVLQCIPAPTTTTGPYVYGFTWTATQIDWYYRVGTQTTPLHTEVRGTGQWAADPWPTQPGRVLMNLWAVDKNDALATGWAGNPTGITAATATFKDVVVP